MRDLVSHHRRPRDGPPTVGDGSPDARLASRTRHGTAFLVREGETGEGFLLFSQTGDLILNRLTCWAFEELGGIHRVDPMGECVGRELVWSHPAFAGR